MTPDRRAVHRDDPRTDEAIAGARAVETIDVLNLVTTARPFFDQQVRVLERNGVSCTTVSVPKAASDGRRGVDDYLRFHGRVLRTVLTGEYDLVHANFGLVAPFALAQPVRPIVLSLWGTDVFGEYGWLSKHCARWVDAVVVMSREMAEAVPVECDVIPHGVDFDRFSPMPRDEACTELGWDTDRRHVLFPYAPSRDVKNYPRAERVVEGVRERLSVPVELHAVHGVPHENVPRYMNAADSLLLTSEWEGSPNAVREALACNLPVVATDVGDVRERLEGVSLSYVCRTDDELVERLATVLDRQSRSDGREVAREVSLDRMGERLLRVYERVLDA